MKRFALCVLAFALGCWIGNRVGYSEGYADGYYNREAEFDSIDEEWLIEQRRLKRIEQEAASHEAQ